MTNNMNMVNVQEKQFSQSPNRKAQFNPGSPPRRYQKSRSPRSSPNHDNSARSSPSKSATPAINIRMRSPRQSPTFPLGPLYAGFSGSPEPNALPQPPSHWIFPILLDAQA